MAQAFYGIVLGVLGRREESRDQMLKAIAMEPDQPLFSSFLGMFYLSKPSFPEKAIEYLQKSAAAGVTASYAYLGLAHTMAGRKEEALRYLAKLEKIEKESERFADVRRSFAEKTGPWLSLNAVVGNIYTGSLFLSLIDLLRSSTSADIRQISMFAYGSGCAASMNVAYPTPGFVRFRDQIDPEPELNERRKLRIDEYEHIMRISDSLGTGDTEELHPGDWDLTGDFFYLGNRKHVRQYSGLQDGSSQARQSDLISVSAHH